MSTSVPTAYRLSARALSLLFLATLASAALAQQMDPDAVPPEATLPSASAPRAVSAPVNANGRPNYPAEVQGTSRFRAPAQQGNPRDLVNQMRLAPGQAAVAPGGPPAGQQLGGPSASSQAGSPRLPSQQMETMPAPTNGQLQGASSLAHPEPAPLTAGPGAAPGTDRDCPGCKHHQEIQTDPNNSTSGNAYPLPGQANSQAPPIPAGHYGEEGKQQYPQSAQNSAGQTNPYGQQGSYGQSAPYKPPAQFGSNTVQQAPDPVAVIETTKGTITMRLFRGLAPKTVSNFIELCQKGFYNGLAFHRVEPGFVIQTGCPIGDGTGSYIDPVTNRPRYIPLELNPRLRHNAAGVVAMARFGTNPNSASSQFYITLAAKNNLDNKYAIFGGVVAGMDVVQAVSRGDKIITIAVQEQDR